jgi:hypothetical protein
MLGMKKLACALPLNLIRQASSLDHGHKAPWWRERLFFDGWLPWLTLLDHGGLMALLHHVRQRIRWCLWSIVSYRTCHRLLCLHPFLKCSTEAKEFPALNEEMSRSSHSILVEVDVPCASSIEHLFCRWWWLITASAPLSFWPRIAASASATDAAVVVPMSWSVVVIIAVLVHVACCYHIRGVHVIVAVPTAFLPGASVKLIFCIDVTLR